MKVGISRLLRVPIDHYLNTLRRGAPQGKERVGREGRKPRGSGKHFKKGGVCMDIIFSDSRRSLSAADLQGRARPSAKEEGKVHDETLILNEDWYSD